MTTAVEVTPDEALAALRSALADVAVVDLHGLSEADLVSFARELESVARRVPAVVAGVDQCLSDRRVRASVGYISDAGLLRSLHRLSMREANARLRVADLVCERQALVGEVLAPRLPATAAVFKAGAISTAHVLVIGEVMDALPQSLHAEHLPMVDAVLAEHATTLDPHDLKKLGARIIAQLHPDGDEPSDEVRVRGRSARLTVLPDGSGELWARLTPSAVAVWQAILTPLMKSGSEPVHDVDGTEVDTPQPVCPDVRTGPEKLHDALEAAGRKMLASGSLPSTAGVPTTLIVTLALKDLEWRIGQATTFHGGTLTIAEALRLAVDAKVIPVILGDADEILAYGRGKRLATAAMRRPLFARDLGCTFPGCSKPAAEAEIHHAHEWVNGGGTDIDNLTVACGFHQNESTRNGWQTVMLNGKPWWRPPAHVAPSRALRRNSYWDPIQRN